MASEEQIDLPPGFRFHPTDEELITQYLSPKVLDHSFSAAAIGEVDMNKYEPWDLPWRGKMGEKEWYFFCVRDRKYPIGLRTNRATNAGYWKATGKDKEIYSEKSLVGMKKTLVFYKGRAPKGEKSNWVTHEYRLEGKHAAFSLPKPGMKVWVLCRVFLKGAGGRIPITRMAPLTPPGYKLDPSRLPSLMESSPCTNSMTRTRIESASHVTCFSNLMEGETHDNITDNFNTGHLPSSSYPSEISTTSVLLPRRAPTREDSQQPYSMFAQENQILRLLLANNFLKTGQNFNPEISQETVLSTDMNTTDISSAVSNHEEVPSNCAGPVDIDSLWNY